MQESTFPSVFVIVLNYEGKDTLIACLKSVLGSDYPNFSVVVVDNASTDGSFEQARDLFPKAHFIRNSANIGFAKGNNVGIRFALEKFADFVFLLNNDAIIEKNTLSKLVKAADSSKKIGIVSPLILGPGKKTVWFAGGIIHWSKMKATHINKIVAKKLYESQYLTGCAMLIKKKVFKDIGLFDERFFLYYEDTDFSYRATKAGFSLAIEPNTTIEHKERSSSHSRSKTYWLVLSGLIFFYTHSNLFRKAWIIFYVSLRKFKNRLDLLFSRNTLAKEVQRAYQDFKDASLR
ncbi:MAG TPA: glycosyltransferase family 2 protein [Patescibacteria group bacterium]